MACVRRPPFSSQERVTTPPRGAMTRGLSGARGLSLVEVTIMLLVLMTLTGVLAPSIMDFIRDAQWVKAREDCEAIGVSVVRLMRDVGPCLKFDGSGSCTKANRVDLLYSDGPDVTANDVTGEAAAGFSGSGNTAGALNWHTDSVRGDSMAHQFVDNGGGPAYPTPSDLGSDDYAGPGTGLGWRGAYLSSPVGPDPWGHRYLVNTVFLAVARDADAGGGEGQRNGGWSHDTFCISAGPNGQYETPFAGNATHGVDRRGDDLLFVISGDTR
jgi:type II secretory pathway pseudopilin PulG